MTKGENNKMKTKSQLETIRDNELREAHLLKQYALNAEDTGYTYEDHGDELRRDEFFKIARKRDFESRVKYRLVAYLNRKIAEAK
jgi:hypothetical protein